MIIIEKRFEYPIIQRNDSPNGRFYVSPEGDALPSVTTILSATKSAENVKVLENWKKRVGQKNAEDIRNGAAALGQIIHGKLEKYLLGEQLTWGTNYIHKLAHVMTETIINQGFKNVQKIFGLEIALYFYNLYAGTTDLIGQINEEIYILDFKNTLRMKKEEWLEDYYTQLVAYALAHNFMFGTNINRGRIMMVARPDVNNVCEYKEFDLDPIKFSKYEDIWLKKLEQFHSQIKL